MARVNFLPWRRYRRQRSARRWAGIAIASALLMGAAGSLWHRLLAAELRREALWQQADALLLTSLAAGEETLKARREAWHKAQASRQRQQDTEAWRLRLLNLAANLPQNAWLTQLRWQQNQLSLSGLASTAGALSAVEQQLRSVAGFQLQHSGAMARDDQGRWQFHYQLDKEDADALQR